jgi:hypothetical protein
MPTVKLPRADWDTIEMFLGDLKSQGYLVGPLLKDIQLQLDKQEY